MQPQCVDNQFTLQLRTELFQRPMGM